MAFYASIQLCEIFLLQRWVASHPRGQVEMTITSKPDNTTKNTVTIRSYLTIPPVMIDKMLLEACGIEPVIQKDNCGGIRPHLRFATGVRLSVRREAKQRAEEVKKRTEETNNRLMVTSA